MHFSPDTSSKFLAISMSPDDNEKALQVSPYFLAYLQNKIEAYASQLVESRLPYSQDPTKQVEAILAHERLRNFVEAFQELQAELLTAAQTPSQSS